MPSDFDLLLQFAAGTESNPDKDSFQEVMTVLNHHEVRVATAQIVKTMFQAKRLSYLDELHHYVDDRLKELSENDELSGSDLLKWRQQLISETQGPQSSGGFNNSQGSTPLSVSINNNLISGGVSETSTPYNQLQAVNFINRLDKAAVDAKLPKELNHLIASPVEE